MGGHDEKDKWVVRSTEGSGEAFEEVLARRLSRRDVLRSAAIASSVAIIGSAAMDVDTAEARRGGGPNFTKIEPTTPEVDEVKVPEGYYVETLLRWGDPLTAGAPDHNVFEQTPAAQAEQFGYNCDFVGYFPLVGSGDGPSNRGLLAVNHEYTNEELMFAAYDPANPTQNQVDVAIAAHGMSVVEIARRGGAWHYVQGSRYNRRLTGETPMRISGPAAGHPWMRTSEDPTGTLVRGTLNNCAGGKTPWGTVLTAEENFHQYFGNLAGFNRADPRYAVHQRYGMPSGVSERQWEKYHPRFDVAREPNEGFRHGWMVEVDPYDPSATPIKRTALGRFRHEAATIGVAPGGQVVAYMGDDSQFEYVYKFISAGRYDRRDRRANMSLLDTGTLYVARFNDDGSGQWLPLVYGQGPLTAANGFSSQADLLINTRRAADLLGATKMDRPEDVEPNPVTKKIYVALTNNTRRGAAGQAPPDAANPRPINTTGHVIEIGEANGDYAATTFRWEMFILAGLPSDPSSFFAGFDKSQVSPIGAPDNVAFDRAGNLWIATDGAPRAIKYNDGLFAVPVEGPERGKLQQFFSTVAGSEVCGPEFTPDNRTLFLAIQHPGEGGTFEAPISTWPDRDGRPKPSVITVQATDNRRIGS